MDRLSVGCIDLYYLHRVDTRRPIEETVRAMAVRPAAVCHRFKFITTGLSSSHSHKLSSPFWLFSKAVWARLPLYALILSFRLWNANMDRPGFLAQELVREGARCCLLCPAACCT